MKPIEWTEKYSVGVDTLDNDHRKLIDLVNQCIVAFGTKNTLKTHDICRELERYTYYHFAREEDLMEKCGYEKLAEHRQKHQDLCDILAEKFRDVVYAPENVENLIQFMRSWLFEHILKEDRQYMSALKGC